MHKINISFIICNMNTIIQKQTKGKIQPSELPDWLVSHGLSTITSEECSHLLGIPVNEIPQRLVRLRAKCQLVSAARGLWIVVPAEYRQMGAPEPIRYIHNLMGYYESEYCIGWLSAASLHGASHQAPQVFQIACGKKLRRRIIGRSELQFYYRSYVPFISKKKVSYTNGSAMVCTPGATMLMSAADPTICAGIDNAATVICELAENHPGYLKDVLNDAPHFSRAAVHRLGWILEHVAGESGLDELAECCKADEQPTVLSPDGSRSGSIDKRWNVIENRRIETDT